MTFKKIGQPLNKSWLWQIIEGIREKNLQAALLFVVFSNTFPSVQRGKMKKILLPYGIPHTKRVTAIMILYKNTKSLVRSPEILASLTSKHGILQGNILAPFLFIITLDYILITFLNTHLVFILSPKLPSQYPTKKLTNIDYADDLTITADTITNPTVSLHNL